MNSIFGLFQVSFRASLVWVSKQWSANCRHIFSLTTSCILVQRLAFNCTVANSKPQFGWLWIPFFKFLFAPRLFEFQSVDPPIAFTFVCLQHLAYLSKDSLLIAQLPKVSHSLVNCEFHFWTFSSFFSRLACLSVEVLIRQLPSQLRACYILHTCSKTCF